MFKFKLGDKVKCLVTGFVGITTARMQYLNGCIQYCVKPPMDKDGKLLDGQYIDEGQLELIEEAVVKVDASEPDKSRPRGGPAQDSPPQSYGG